MIKLHPHAIGQIMSNPTAAAMKAGEVLSVGAKTYLRKLAKQSVYGFRPVLDTKPIKKGLLCENDSIDLLNAVLFTDYSKNTTRIENEWLTGEADIVADDCIIDTKTSWSLETFPATEEDGENSDYEWQGRAYMMLYDKPRFTLAYCMVSTPDDLIGYEDSAVHKVDHIEPAMRITLLHFIRDLELEAKIIEKCQAAQVYVDQMIEKIKESHKY